MVDYTQHPFSAAWPRMDQTSFAEFSADIAANGLRSSIVVFEDQVLDGWSRLLACRQTGIPPRYEEFNGSDEDAAKRFVISANRHRRHMSPSQLGMVAAILATMGHGSDRRSGDQEATLSLDRPSKVRDVATLFGISPRIMKDCRVVHSAGNPDLIGKVQAGNKSASQAAKEVRLLRGVIQGSREPLEVPLHIQAWEPPERQPVQSMQEKLRAEDSLRVKSAWLGSCHLGRLDFISYLKKTFPDIIDQAD